MLKLVGKILHLSKSGNLIVKGDAKNLPKIGDDVFNKKMEKIGFVYDIIGPTKSPYIVIKPVNRKKFDEDNLFVVVKDGRGGESKRKGDRKKGKGKGNRKKGNRKRGNN